MAVQVKLSKDDLQEFLTLTSDIAIREAAYPIDQWVQSGGNPILYKIVSFNDDVRTSFRLNIQLNNQPKPTVHCSKSGKPMHMQNSLLRAENIANYLMKLKKHNVYKWLNQSVHFNSAHEKFFKLKIHSKSNINKSEYDDIRFIGIVARFVGTRELASQTDSTTCFPSSKELNQAKGHVNKLLNLISKGIALSDIKNQSQLIELLVKLNAELDLSPRKPKVSVNFETRLILEKIAYNFILTFSATYTTILHDLAWMMDWSVNPTTIAKLVEQVRSKHRLGLYEESENLPILDKWR